MKRERGAEKRQQQGETAVEDATASEQSANTSIVEMSFGSTKPNKGRCEAICGELGCGDVSAQGKC